MSEIDDTPEDDGPAEKPGALATLRDPGIVYEPDDLGRIFTDMLPEVAAAKHFERRIAPKTFAEVARRSGTHSLKMITPRADKDQAILRFGDSRIISSHNAADGLAIRIVFRPIAIAGQPGSRTIFDHLARPDNHSPAIAASFAAAFGEEALDALREAVCNPAPPITELPGGEFPIVFLPNPAGGDLQVTPISPAEAWMHMGAGMGHFFTKSVKGEPPPRRGRWSRQAVTGKMNNVSIMLGGTRRRFDAGFPDMAPASQSAIWAFARGGPLPSLRDELVSDALGEYVRLTGVADRVTSVPPPVAASLDNLADLLIRLAHGHVIDCAHAALEIPDAVFILPDAPVRSLLIRRKFADEKKRNEAIAALATDHFSKRLRAADLDYSRMLKDFMAVDRRGNMPAASRTPGETA